MQPRGALPAAVAALDVRLTERSAGADSMTASEVVDPVVVREIGDLELMYFASIEDVLQDRFDGLWGEAYEGWDARGHRFEVRRHYPALRWWERLLLRASSHLAVTSVESMPSPEIGSILAHDLGLPPDDRSGLDGSRRIRDLIRMGLDR